MRHHTSEQRTRSRWQLSPPRSSVSVEPTRWLSGILLAWLPVSISQATPTLQASQPARQLARTAR